MPTTTPSFVMLLEFGTLCLIYTVLSSSSLNTFIRISCISTCNYLLFITWVHTQISILLLFIYLLSIDMNYYNYTKKGVLCRPA